jgi:hypothetical protein
MHLRQLTLEMASPLHLPLYGAKHAVTPMILEVKPVSYTSLATIYLCCTSIEVPDVCFLLVNSLKTILIDENVFDRVSPLSRHPPSAFKEVAAVRDLTERIEALPKLTEFVRVCKNDPEAESIRLKYRARPSPLENAITTKLGKEMSFISAAALEDSDLGRSLMLN